MASDLGGRKTGKIMYRTIIYFLFASMLSATFGILVAYLIRPGHVISSSVGKGVKLAEPKVFDNFLDLGRLVLLNDGHFFVSMMAISTQGGSNFYRFSRLYTVQGGTIKL